MDISQEISTIGRAFAEGLKGILGEKLFAVYFYGAAAFPDTLPTGDIDFHVILKSELSGDERQELEVLHQSLAERYPPLGGKMDGYYILLSDAVDKSPPRSQMWDLAVDYSFALHREHMRAGRCIILYGPDPTQVYPPAAWAEIEEALMGELEYVEKHLQQYPDYCILNLCRLIYSFETKEVVLSKAQAAGWAARELPEWDSLVELAKKSYAHQATPEDQELMQDEVGDFLQYSQARIAQARL